MGYGQPTQNWITFWITKLEIEYTPLKYHILQSFQLPDTDGNSLSTGNKMCALQFVHCSILCMCRHVNSNSLL